MDAQPGLMEILEASPLLPVMTIGAPADAPPLAEALMAAGIFNLEITLRAEGALESIRAASRLARMTVGAGTVFTAEQARAAAEAGARYIVSPGYSAAVAAACRDLKVPYLPGAVTATEIQAAQEKGFHLLKFFPAEAGGGVPVLKALAPVFERIRFCATGGISPENAAAYLAAPNVVAVGMSALAPAAAVKAKDWAAVTEAARGIVRKVGK
jgi:2-dehydro-3-deoxyphosphogluconate aldolase/(4S)-4-hydroxy-2-oxoglutarate aldolase